MLKPAAPSGGGRARGRGSQPAAEAKTEEQVIGEKVGKLLSDAGAPTTAPSDAASITAMEKFVAKDMTQSCSKCHTVTDATSPGELMTTPTGFRPRWFTAARFDHDAHRDLGCQSCHVGVKESEKTSDLLLPDVNTAAAGSQTCVQCHLAESTGQRGAPAACATCHNFHDRHFERALLTAATTRPIAR
jgi:nitrate/TMAO reductase-like tetraheme cytochrome c subunit